ncbi:hypothetical protein [uncultured Fusobacterium sp.]|uniref:hypothetical protein n=1 Tax=uncultured Fusobacterium sp. TaxID=159267 RepID=UPI0025E989FA|nr:hypothetical protein [uncultured Fusobacterium sp.]
MNIKKIGLGVIGTLIILVGGVYFSKDIIVKYILEEKLTEINKGKVDIGSVDFSPFNKRIVVKDIDFTSQRDGMKNFITIGEFNADYDVYIPDKKVLISEAHIIKFDFLTDRKTDGSIDGNFNKKPLDAYQIIIPANTEEKKDQIVKNIENSYLDQIRINDLSLNNILKSEYDRSNSLLDEKKNYWETRIKEIEDGAEFKEIRRNLKKVSSLKNPLDIFKMDREVKGILQSAKTLNEKLSIEKEQLKLDLQDMKNSPELQFSVDKGIENFVTNGEIVIKDLDTLVNIYLNQVYEKKMYELVVKYREVVKELELRKEEDKKEINKWELYIEELDITSDTYGFMLNGEVHNISSRLSRNTENISFMLTGDKNQSHGKMDGYVNIDVPEGYINIDIQKVDLDELKEFNDYINGGTATMAQKTILSKEDIIISGNLNINNMNLNGRSIVDTMNLKMPLLKEMIIPLLSEVKNGKISYGYDSQTRKVYVKSNLSKEITKILNSNNGYWKKKISEDLKKASESEILKYEKLLREKEEEIRKVSEENLNIQIGELEKIDEQIKYLKSKNKKDILNDLFQRF